MSVGQVRVASLGVILVVLFCLTCGEEKPAGPCGNTRPTASLAVTPHSGIAEHSVCRRCIGVVGCGG